MRSLVVVSILLAASLAEAQPGAMDPDPASPPPPMSRQKPEEKSETTALALSLGGTLVSYAALTYAVAFHTPLSAPVGTLGAFGIVGAPTAGHWYAGRIFTRGFGLRATGLVVLLVGALVDNEGCSLVYGGDAVRDEPEDCGDDFRTKKGTALMISGAVLFFGGTIDDIVTAPGAVQRRNARERASMTVAPLVHRDGGGLALLGTF